MYRPRINTQHTQIFHKMNQREIAIFPRYCDIIKLNPAKSKIGKSEKNGENVENCHPN